MMRIILIIYFCVGILFGQTKWSKCKVDDTKLRECLDGEIKKKEWNKWYIAYECEGKNTKHYYWVANKIISDDVLEKKFVCDLTKCKGACCVEGDAGAPLESDEVKILKEIFYLF